MEGIPKGRDPLDDLGVYRRIILKLALKKYGRYVD
jgi:hypothetical protein